MNAAHLSLVGEAATHRIHVTLQKECPLAPRPFLRAAACGRGRGRGGRDRGGPTTPIFREFLLPKNNNGEKMLSGPEFLGDFAHAFVGLSSSERAFKAGKKAYKRSRKV